LRCLVSIIFLVGSSASSEPFVGTDNTVMKSILASERLVLVEVSVSNCLHAKDGSASLEVSNSKHMEPESAAVMRALFVIGSEEVIVMVS